MREACRIPSFIRLHAMYRERGDVLTHDNHEIMPAISAAFRFILAFYSAMLSVVGYNTGPMILANALEIIMNMTHDRSPQVTVHTLDNQL